MSIPWWVKCIAVTVSIDEASSIRFRGTTFSKVFIADSSVDEGIRLVNSLEKYYESVSLFGAFVVLYSLSISEVNNVKLSGTTTTSVKCMTVPSVPTTLEPIPPMHPVLPPTPVMQPLVLIRTMWVCSRFELTKSLSTSLELGRPPTRLSLFASRSLPMSVLFEIIMVLVGTRLLCFR